MNLIDEVFYMSTSYSLTRNVTHFVLMFILVFTAGSTTAQDTEIFFSGGTISASTDQSILPNVLFILDTSGSMTNDLTDDPQGRSRIEVLRERTVTRTTRPRGGQEAGADDGGDDALVARARAPRVGLAPVRSEEVQAVLGAFDPGGEQVEAGRGRRAR